MSNLKNFMEEENWESKAEQTVEINNDFISFLTIPDGSFRKVQFVKDFHELDFIVEHADPKDFRKSTICTFLTGECLGCEQRDRQWNQKIKVLIPVLHSGQIKIMTQGVGVNSLTMALQKEYRERGTITEVKYNVKRVGSSMRTKYFVSALDNQPVMQYNESVDLSRFKTTLTYEEQKNFYKI